MLQEVRFTIHTYFLHLNFCWYSYEKQKTVPLLPHSLVATNNLFYTLKRLHLGPSFRSTDSITHCKIIPDKTKRDKLTWLLKKMTEIFSFFSLSGSSPNSSPNFYENFGVDLVVCGMGWGQWSINVNGPAKKLQYGVHGLQKELSHQQDTSGNFLGCSWRIDWSIALRKNWIFLFEWVLSDVTYAARKSTVGLPGYGMAWHDVHVGYLFCG